MDDRTSMTGFEAPEVKELTYLASIRPALVQAVIKQGGPGDLIAFKPRKAATSVSFQSFTVFRLCLREKGQQYLSIPSVFQDMIPPEFPSKNLRSDTGYVRLYIDGEHPVESYTEFLAKIAGETVNRYPKEWDCCSRYMECSDAKHCVHPDKTLALECGYRKILNSGKVFYGKNRNID